MGAVTGRPISSVVRALDVLSDAWSFLILREAFFGVRRFGDLQRGLGIARNMLSDRLNHLVQEGVLARLPYQDRPARHEYRLTKAGRDFYPAIVELMRWGDRWLPDPSGPPLILFDPESGKPVRPQVVCAQCRQPISPFDVDLADGPGAGVEAIDAGGGLGHRRRSAVADELYARGRPCSVARTLALIGDRWSFRILRESFFAVSRFEDLKQNLGVARNILSDRLDRLVAGGVLAKRLYQERPSRYEYVLTQPGLDLYPAFLLLMRWGDTWRRPNEGAPLVLFHRSCGERIVPELIDAETGGTIDAGNIAYRMNYAMS